MIRRTISREGQQCNFYMQRNKLNRLIYLSIHKLSIEDVSEQWNVCMLQAPRMLQPSPILYNEQQAPRMLQPSPKIHLIQGEVERKSPEIYKGRRRYVGQ